MVRETINKPFHHNFMAIIDNHVFVLGFRSFPFVLGLRKDQKIQSVPYVFITKIIHGNWRRYTIEHLCISLQKQSCYICKVFGCYSL